MRWTNPCCKRGTLVTTLDEQGMRETECSGRRANGRNHDLLPLEARHRSIVMRSASDIAAELPRTRWLLRPYLERDAMAVLYGDYGTYKSFVVLDWAMRAALGLSALGYSWPAERADVLLISAEGRSLAQRLRAWCSANCPDESFQSVLARTPLDCIEHPVNLSAQQSVDELVAAIDARMIKPQLLIIDTLTRNSDGRIEESTANAAAYLARVDQDLRSRYRCTVVMTHHVGHEKGRMRGPIVLAANTDTLIRIDRLNSAHCVATLTVERMKDCEPPPPQGLHARIVGLGEEDADGQALTSLALEASDAPFAPGPAKAPDLRGKAKQKLLKALQARNEPPRSWSIDELREIGRESGMHKSTARSAAEALTRGPHMTATDGGWKLTGSSGTSSAGT
jgi:hypothetical protein